MDGNNNISVIYYFKIGINGVIDIIDKAVYIMRIINET